MQQIIPPITNAFAIFAARLCFGVMDSTYSLYAWSRTFLSAPYDTLDKFFCFCSSDVLAELLCLVVGCAMVFPPVYFPLIGIVCQIFSIFIRSFSKELLEWADAPYDSNPNYPEQLIHKIVTVHRYCSPFPHRSSSFICSSYSSVGL